LPKPVQDYDSNKTIGLITFGTNEPAIQEGRDRLSEAGIETNYMRVRSLPLSEEVTEFINKHDRLYVLENNFDGQLAQIIHLEHADDMKHVQPLTLGDGLPMTAKWVFDQVIAQENN